MQFLAHKYAEAGFQAGGDEKVMLLMQGENS